MRTLIPAHTPDCSIFKDYKKCYKVIRKKQIQPHLGKVDETRYRKLGRNSVSGAVF